MGPWDRLVIALVPIVLILSVTGVIILRPLSRRLADVLELLIDERDVRGAVDAEEVLRRLDAIEARLARIDDVRGVEGGDGPKGGRAVGPGEMD